MIEISVRKKVLDLIDAAAAATGVTRSTWINLAIREKLTTRGLRDIPAVYRDDPHDPPEELSVLREMVENQRVALKAKDDEILWLRKELLSCKVNWATEAEKEIKEKESTWKSGFYQHKTGKDIHT
jgi:hypothetical protein